MNDIVEPKTAELNRVFAAAISRDDQWRQLNAYARAWRETFAARIRASSLFAALTVPPLPSRASIASSPGVAGVTSITSAVV